MKRLLLLTAVAATTLTQAAHADGDISIRFNGNPLTAEQPPVVVNDRTLVPVRAVCEAMGLEVGWEPETQGISISGDNTSVKLEIGYHTIDVNGNLDYIEAAPTLINSVTCVPIRAVVEPFGAIVDWDGSTRTVIIDVPEEENNTSSGIISGSGSSSGSSSSKDDEEIEENTPPVDPEDSPPTDEEPETAPEVEEDDEDEEKPTISNPVTPSITAKPFTFYAQEGEEWGFESNGRGYCWVCSYAMLITDLLGERVTPVDIAEYNLNAGSGSGNYMASHFGLAAEYGLEFVPALDESSEYFDYFDSQRRGATYFKAETEEDVKNALIEALERNPKGVLVRFEGYPHTLVATGYFDGEIYFNDPGSLEMENVTFENTCLGRNFSWTDLTFVQAMQVK
ncbi:MAG: hypothetical protein IJ366_09645 [Clostridia bacterium]|nr:hypothetical protein [Clostridia bacterium]